MVAPDTGSLIPTFFSFYIIFLSLIEFQFLLPMLTPSSWGDRKWFLRVPPRIGCSGSGLCLVVLCSGDGDQR